ncbi:hypothetical protein [Parageobacillus thermoglucosidasius]|nr:hypothetical protein [Parageobacillus thermoglucosidasius]
MDMNYCLLTIVGKSKWVDHFLRLVCERGQGKGTIRDATSEKMPQSNINK